MALRDSWIEQDNTMNADASVINQIADAVIELEKNGGGGGSADIDTKMSDTSEKAVQNKVIKKYVDESMQIAILDSWEVAV